MARQIRLLTKLSLQGMFGLNEFRFTKDRRKKVRYCLMGCLWALLIVMLAGYVGIFSFGLLLTGLGAFVPAVLGMCVAALVFFFTMFKAGAVLFDKDAYEKQIALPVTVRAIIVSRFLSMYITDMLLGLVVMAPGMVVYGVMARPGLSFYIYGVAAVLFLPLLPMTAASVAGALIAAVSSRWRKKNLVSILLTLGLVCIIMFGSMRLGEMEESQVVAVLQEMASLLEGRIRSVYPPAMWMAEAMVGGNPAKMALFLGVSLGGFLIFLEILQRFYSKICILLGARETKGNYRMKELHAKSVLGSLVEREWRHYISSTVYVTNTLVGELMMVIVAVAVLVAGRESVDALLGIPGVAQKAMPILLGFMPSMMPLTASSISLEGKQWWMLQTLPVTRRDMVHSKVALNLLVAFPFYLLSEILLFVALRPGWADGACLVIVPLFYIVFSARLGLAVNERFPVFDWDSEIKVVKQGASAFVTMLAGAVTAIVPIAILLFMPGISPYLVYGGVVAALAVLTIALELAGGRKEAAP